MHQWLLRVCQLEFGPYSHSSFLEAALQQYREPVAVSFISDNSIDVNLSNVGNLGRFTQRTLTLRPGTYTLRGSKNGCRDIYANISVLPNMPPVEIFCTEPLR